MSDRLFTPRFLGLWVFAFITFFSAFQLLPAIPFRIIELGGSKTVASLFLTAYTLASALAAPVMGNLADRVGRKRMLVIASTLFIGFSIAYGTIPYLPLLLLIGVVHGAIWSALLSSSSALMTDMIPASRRTQGLAFWGISSTAAVSVAPMVGLNVFERFGWTALCYELAALSVLMAVWSSFIPDPGAEGDTSSQISLLDAWDWKVVKTAASLAVTAFGYGGITTFAAVLAVERNILPPSLYFTVFAITIVVIRVFTSHLGDRFGPKAVLYPSFAALPVSFAVLAVAQNRWQLVVSAVLFGIGLGGAFPAFMSFLVAHTDPRRRARTFGSFVLAFDTGIGLGSLVVGFIGDRWGLGTAFLVAAALSCLAIPIFTAASRGLGSGGTAVAAESGHAGTG
ncbi:MAG TPA: MFS transporter [Thermoanaerobaculia bacterium]